MTEAVVEYMNNEPKLVADLPNHLGHTGFANFYPKSVWIDSYVAWGMFSSIYATDSKDDSLIAKATKHPKQFAEFLKNDNGLYSHTYIDLLKSTYPKDLYWGRGNGLVLCCLPIMLENMLDIGNIKLFQELAEAILPYQRDDYYFNTVLNKESYRESSATLFIASGLMQGVREGYLSDEYIKPSVNAFEAVVDDLLLQGEKIYLQEVSDLTYPTIVLPYTFRFGKYSGYKNVRKENNSSYGLAALFLAAIQYKKLRENR